MADFHTDERYSRKETKRVFASLLPSEGAASYSSESDKFYSNPFVQAFSSAKFHNDESYSRNEKKQAYANPFAQSFSAADFIIDERYSCNEAK